MQERASGINRQKAITALCFVLIGVCFMYSVVLRQKWFARPLGPHHEWLTAHSVCVTRNWLNDGAFKLKFMHVLNPDSIEFSGLALRDPYVSYPPGAFIPAFLIAKAFGIQDLIRLYQAYNLANHLAIAWMLFALMLMIIDGVKAVSPGNIAFSAAPSLVYLFTPPTLYWHQNVFFADQAVMLFFVIFVYLEMKYYLNRTLKSADRLLLGGTVFLGVLTDWLFVFVIAVAAVLRVLFFSKDASGRVRQIAVSARTFVAPALAGIGIYAYQIFSAGALGRLLKTFFWRSGVGWKGIFPGFLEHYLAGHIVDGYGLVLTLSTVAAVVMVFLYGAFEKGRGKTPARERGLAGTAVYLVLLTVLPCVLQGLVFQQHSMIHDFAALKWALSFSLIPFGIFPVVYFTRAPEMRRRKMLDLAFLLSFFVLLSGGVFFRTAFCYERFFGEDDDQYKRVGELVKRNAAYHDLCLSFDFEITDLPPEALAYSQKRVYRITELHEAEELAAQLPKGQARVKIFLFPATWETMRDALADACSAVYTDSDTHI
ncbi:MAG TPA: hypothetical protein P5246_03295, partial [Candidatus Omnitrophota bacterium]|nr:hypothetical protein [Candidatus Omnitrophota bacterium]